MSQGETQQDNEDCSSANQVNVKTNASILAEKFAEDHYDEVFRYCARRLPTKEDAQDATQEIFLRLVRSRALYESNDKPLAYLYTCARNVCADFYRKGVPGDLRTDIEWEDVPDPSTKDGSQCMSLAEAVASLAPEEREVIELRYGQDLSVADIAQVLGVSRFTVYRSCKRALRSLRLAIGDD